MRDLPVPGERLGAYDIVADIARGGMAAVYLARKRFDVGGLGKLVAIKVLLPHLRDPEFVAMFLDEVRVAVSIAHANVVQVLDVGESDGWPYMVMEYLRGQPLEHVVRRVREGDDPSEGPILLALAQAAAGLHAAHETLGDDGHSLRIVHRDVAPRNIHVGYDGCTKIVDFGIAASRGKVVATQPNVVKGTLQYVAPELISRAHAIDRRADIWSFGVVAWEALAGRRLFSGDSEAEILWSVLEQEVPDLSTCAPRIPDAVARPIMACLQRDPNRRPRDLREIEEPLSRAAQFAGGATIGDLAALVTRLFDAERVRDDERLQTQVTRSLAARPRRAASEVESTRVRRPVPETRRRRRWFALAGLAMVAAGVVAAGAVAARGLGPSDRADAAPPTGAAQPSPAAPGPPSPAAPAEATTARPSPIDPTMQAFHGNEDTAAPPATGGAVSPARAGTVRPGRRPGHATVRKSDVRASAPAAAPPSAPPATPPPASAPAASTVPAPAEKPLLDNPYR